MEPTSRTGHYWIVWEERQGRWRLRAISRTGALTTVGLALLAASAGVLVAATQADIAWIGLLWAGWVLGVAFVLGRALGVHGQGLIRHSSPFGRRDKPSSGAFTFHDPRDERREH